jgi:hypothetical protein
VRPKFSGSAAVSIRRQHTDPEAARGPPAADHSCGCLRVARLTSHCLRGRGPRASGRLRAWCGRDSCAFARMTSQWRSAGPHGAGRGRVQSGGSGVKPEGVNVLRCPGRHGPCPRPGSSRSWLRTPGTGCPWTSPRLLSIAHNNQETQARAIGRSDLADRTNWRPPLRVKYHARIAGRMAHSSAMWSDHHAVLLRHPHVFSARGLSRRWKACGIASSKRRRACRRRARAERDQCAHGHYRPSHLPRLKLGKGGPGMTGTIRRCS